MAVPPLKARRGPGGLAYRSSRTLVRLHGQPLGVVEVALDDGQASPHRVAQAIEAHLSCEIATHLAGDSIPLAGAFTADGLEVSGRPRCRDPLPDVDQLPLVTAVVCTHSRTPGLAETLASIAANDYPRFEVVVVDNNPIDPGVRELVDGYRSSDSRFRYVREWSQGLSRARNTGYLFSRGEIVAFTDDDVVTDPGWLSALVAAFMADPVVSCVTGLVLAKRLDSATQLRFEQTAGFVKGFHQRTFDMGEHRPESPIFPLAAGAMGTGANFAVRKVALDDLWQFDPALGTGTIAAGGEDLDCFAELIFSGRRITYEPRALIWHDHVEDEVQLSAKMHAYGVGFSAYLTKQFVRGRGRRLRMMRAVPAAVTYALREGSRHDPRNSTPDASALLWAEIQGMAFGPWAYLRSRMHNAWLTA